MLNQGRHFRQTIQQTVLRMVVQMDVVTGTQSYFFLCQNFPQLPSLCSSQYTIPRPANLHYAIVVKEYLRYTVKNMSRPAGEAIAQTPPSTPECTFRPYKVSEVGQMTLPAELRRNLGLTDGGYIEVCYFGEAVLIVPLGASESLITATFPFVDPDKMRNRQGRTVEFCAWLQSDSEDTDPWASAAAAVTPATHPSIKRTEAMADTFHPYKVSSAGQFTLPAELTL